MGWMHGHFIEKCVKCFAVISQCRCAHPHKFVRDVDPSKCPFCIEKAKAAEVKDAS